MCDVHLSLILGTVCQTINRFKAGLDKFWMHQDVLYMMMMMILLVWQPIGWVSYKQSTV